jgi:hypothetical protein
MAQVNVLRDVPCQEASGEYQDNIKPTATNTEQILHISLLA